MIVLIPDHCLSIYFRNNYMTPALLLVTFLKPPSLIKLCDQIPTQFNKNHQKSSPFLCVGYSTNLNRKVRYAKDLRVHIKNPKLNIL